jgi:hypothetical protein
MLNTGMAKNQKRHPPVPAAPVAKRKRGRPPSPNGPKSQAEIQRAYRARLAAAGKLVRIVDASAIDSAAPGVAVASFPDFDPARDGIYDRAIVEKMRDDLHHALIDIRILDEDRTRWQNDCARAEAELRIERQHHTNTIKEKIVLQKEIAALKQKPRRTNR